METKKCGTCSEIKLLTEFNYRNRKKNTRTAYCKKCHSIYLKKHYKENLEYYLRKAKHRREICSKLNINRLSEYLNTHSCVDCGESDVIVLELDHIKGKKKGEVGVLAVQGYSWGTVAREIEKCEVRCANCRRRKTAKERGWDKKYAPVAQLDRARVFGTRG